MIVDLLRQSYTLVFLRAAAPGAPLDRVSAACAASARHPDGRWRWRVEGDERVATTTDAAALAARSPIALTTGGDAPLTLTWHRDLLRQPAEDVLRIHVPRQAAVPLTELLVDVAAAYGAQMSWLTTFDLSLLVGESMRRAQLASTPEDMREFLPPPPDLLALVDTSIVERFAALAPSGQIDRLRLPEAVHWADAWPTDLVARVGRRRVDGAPWHQRRTEGDLVLLVAADEPPERERPRALAAVADCIDAIALPALQHARRAEGDS